jgi:hypothetical protein
MIKTATSFLLASSLSWFAATYTSAATVPAGTPLVVKTLEVVSSNEAPGTKFKTQLSHPVAANGKVVLPAGTTITGKVESSRRMLSSRERLTASLIEATVGGRVIPIKTGIINLENFTGSSGVSFAHDYYHVPAKRTLKFQLSQPLQF